MMKKIKKFFNKPIFSLVCYLMAILTLVYLIYTVKISFDTVNAYVEQGTLSWSADIGDIISFFISSSVNYIFYLFAFIFFGKVISALYPKKEYIEDTEMEICEDVELSDDSKNLDKEQLNQESSIVEDDTIVCDGEEVEKNN